MLWNGLPLVCHGLSNGVLNFGAVSLVEGTLMLLRANKPFL